MHDPTANDAAKAADFITIYQIVPVIPSLPWPFTGPDRAAFYFVDARPDVAREAVAMAKQVFAGAFGAVFGYRDIWTENGTRRQYKARLESGLAIVLMARADQMQDEAVTPDAGELVAA